MQRAAGMHPGKQSITVAENSREMVAVSIPDTISKTPHTGYKMNQFVNCCTIRPRAFIHAEKISHNS